MKRRRLSDTYEDIRHLSDAYEPRRRLSNAYDQNLKKKINFLIFGRFKRKNPRAVGSNRQILDRNVVVKLLFQMSTKVTHMHSITPHCMFQF